MRAQNFYITDINALEDAASHFYSERDKADTESNQMASFAPTSSPRLAHASIAFTADAQGRCEKNLPVALDAGQTFAIREGGRTVGAGTVTALLD